MQLQDTTIDGLPAKTFDDRPEWRNIRRFELEKAVRKAWEAHGLPIRRPWHELRKTDLEQMANTIGILGSVAAEEPAAPQAAPANPAFTATPAEIEFSREAKRQELATMRFFGLLAIAKKFDVVIPEKPTPEQKAAVVEEILDRMEAL